MEEFYKEHNQPELEFSSSSSCEDSEDTNVDSHTRHRISPEKQKGRSMERLSEMLLTALV